MSFVVVVVFTLPLLITDAVPDLMPVLSVL